MNKLVVSFILGSLFASSSTVSALCPHPRVQPHPVQEFFWDPFEPPLNRSQMEMNVKQRALVVFGEPENKKSIRIPDRDEPGVDTIIETWTYNRGLKVVMAGYNQNRRYLEQIVVSGPDVELKLGIKIGMTREQYWSRMGWEEPPEEENLAPGYVQYCDENNVEHHIELHRSFERGLLTELVWKHIPFRQ
jgi:hypothetical protein